MSNNKSHFYVKLFSNGSQTLYPANTLTAFTARLALSIDLGSMDSWEVGLCEFTCHPRNVGTFAGLDVVSAKVAFLYCDLISPQFVGSQYVRCLRTFVLPTTYYKASLTCITCPWRNGVFRTYVSRYCGRGVSRPN